MRGGSCRGRVPRRAGRSGSFSGEGGRPVRRTGARARRFLAPLPPAKKLGVLKNVTDLTTTVLFLLCMALAFAELTA